LWLKSILLCVKDVAPVQRFVLLKPRLSWDLITIKSMPKSREHSVLNKVTGVRGQDLEKKHYPDP
jgi:hypothetical protein